MVLKTLSALGSLGYGIARRIEQISGNLLQLNQGTIYPALLASSRWDGSAPHGACRKTTGAPSTTRSLGGRKQLAAEEENWRRASEIMVRFLDPSGENTLPGYEFSFTVCLACF